MDNQHKHIKGYRDLSKDEIDLMNQIKEAGGNLLKLQAQLMDKLKKDFEVKCHAAKDSLKNNLEVTGSASTANENELVRFVDAEPIRWASIGRTDIQTGIMALVRAVAQPAGV